jgi:hypothetical protein
MSSKGTVSEKKAMERRKAWLRVLAAELGLYALGSGMAIAAGSPALLRAVVLLGGFAAPATVLVSVFERRMASRRPAAQRVVVRPTRRPGKRYDA